jgi:hypothetical protein
MLESEVYSSLENSVNKWRTVKKYFASKATYIAFNVFHYSKKLMEENILDMESIKTVELKSCSKNFCPVLNCLLKILSL